MLAEQVVHIPLAALESPSMASLKCSYFLAKQSLQNVQEQIIQPFIKAEIRNTLGFCIRNTISPHPSIHDLRLAVTAIRELACHGTRSEAQRAQSSYICHVHQSSICSVKMPLEYRGSFLFVAESHMCPICIRLLHHAYSVTNHD